MVLSCDGYVLVVCIFVQKKYFCAGTKSKPPNKAESDAEPAPKAKRLKKSKAELDTKPPAKVAHAPAICCHVLMVMVKVKITVKVMANVNGWSWSRSM